MSTLIVAALSFVGFIVAYQTYGRWLGRKIFNLNPADRTPAHEFHDGMDFVPTRRSVLFGHHFTSIAGTGPIVGPAIAVFWGWLPALLWVVFGSIFVGAVHDFGTLVLSLRHEGKTLGDVAGRIMSHRAKLLLMCLLLLELMIVLAVFGLVIANIFSMYHGGVLAVWISLPIAVGIGVWHYKCKGHLLIPALLAVAVVYVLIWVGLKYVPVDIMKLLHLDAIENPSIKPYINSTTVWTVILFIYCFFASVLPVWLLLQPRDYVNSNQLYVAMIAIIAGMVIAGFSGQADLTASAPAIAKEIPADAPPILPFLFITVACGAVSGFHSLVSSGTSSKQLTHESDAQLIGYGSMILEGGLAVVVILACCAGVGMGVYTKVKDKAGVSEYSLITDADGQPLTGRAAWREKYHYEMTKDADGKVTGGWKNMTLEPQLRAFIEGGANFLKAVGIPLHFAIDMLGVMVACFAATTIDTATRLQRYVIQELGHSIHVKPLQNKYVATLVAVVTAAALAIFLKVPGPKGEYGSGGLILWPMFGAVNQILAGLGFLVVAVWLIRQKKPIWFLLPPAVLMLVIPAWAMADNMIDWYTQHNWLLLGFGWAIQLLTAWLIVEAILAWRNARRNGLA